jgi:mono/diheme cytochrome c family protein
MDKREGSRNRGNRALASPNQWLGGALLSLLALALPGAAASASETLEGVVVTYTSSNRQSVSDFVATDHLSLFVPAGGPPTPFMPDGPFTASFDGFISVNLRDRYKFRAELNGSLKLKLNDRVVLEGSSEGASLETTESVRLNRGGNKLEVVYTSPEQGDALLRLFWSSLEIPWEPVPPGALSRPASHADLEKAGQLRLGRALFAEFQCIRCHQADLPSSAMLELQMDAPDLEGIGSRRNFEWLARWIAGPQAARPSARMPAVLHGQQTRVDAADIAAYLMSLKTAAAPELDVADAQPERIAAGERLFQELHCGACHEPPGGPGADPGKISLHHLGEKFAPGMLAVFLQKPDAHHAWTRMPDFQLSPQEAKELAAWLDSPTGAPKPSVPEPDPVRIQRGRKLAQTTGCLNCHQLPLENQFAAKSLASLPASRWEMGCLAGERDADNFAPRFAFTSKEREALRAFATTDRLSLARHVPAEFAARQVQRLSCLNCHGPVDGFPPLAHLGGKLKPEWTELLLGGELNYKPRPWLSARMPAFAQYARALACGLAAQHGHPPETPPEPPLDEGGSELGRRMVGVVSGFSCVACHQVGAFNAVPVDTEAAGINLAYVTERLLYSYYERWMSHPLRIDPETKMPAYFEQGRSLLVEYYDGDAERQIRAMWEYLRLGPRMPWPMDGQPSGP